MTRPDVSGWVGVTPDLIDKLDRIVIYWAGVPKLAPPGKTGETNVSIRTKIDHTRKVQAWALKQTKPFVLRIIGSAVVADFADGKRVIVGSFDPDTMNVPLLEIACAAFTQAGAKVRR